MTDEKVKEEMLKLLDLEGDYNEQELAFQNDMAEKGIKTESSSAFYAGFRTAERLAKIEVLEEVIKEIEWVSEGYVHECICNRLDELKATN